MRFGGPSTVRAMRSYETQARHRADIDGLRAIAIIPVVLEHAGAPIFPGGFVGVDVFFVISGFLITGILRREMASGSFSLTRFYERRARRLLPALLVMILFCLPFAWAWMLPEFLANFGQSIVATLLFSNNILLAMTSGYWELESAFKPLLHTWSLGVEEQFYIVFPLLLFLVWKAGKAWQLGMIAFVGILSLCSAQYGAQAFPAANFYLPTSRAWELMIGAAMTFLPVSERRFDGVLSLTGLLLILASALFLREDFLLPSAILLPAAIGTALILQFCRPGTICHAVLTLRPMVGIGLISYSLYLWHQPLFAFARIYSLEPPSAMVMAVLTLLSVVLAFVSWRYVEQPFRQKNRISLRTLTLVTGLPSLALIAFGLFLHVENGLPNRVFPPTTSKGDLYIAYNERIRDYSKPAFPDNGRLDVLIAGNSVARDFTNVLIEAGYDARVNLVYRSDYNQCEKIDTPEISTLTREADVIIFVGHDGGDCIETAYDTLAPVSKAEIVFVGPKNFGYNMNPFVRIPIAERGETMVKVPEKFLAANETHRKLVPPDHYVDLISVIGNGKELPVFDEQGYPLSQDRVHLTRFGAIYIAKRLEKFPGLLAILNQEPKQ